MKMPLKNLAIVAHVDHGKTTLVDEILKQSNTFGEREEVQDRVMDSGDIEKKEASPSLLKTVHSSTKISNIT